MNVMGNGDGGGDGKGGGGVCEWKERWARKVFGIRSTHGLTGLKPNAVLEGAMSSQPGPLSSDSATTQQS